MDRCALFVDASYVLADGAMAVHGTRHRDSVAWDYTGLLKFLSGLAQDRTGRPVLRCYWYEAAAEGRRTSEHDALADIPGLKLRLGRVRPGRHEGIETELHRDLTTLARNGAISDAIVVSGEEELAEVIAEVQDTGIRVTLVHITVDGNWTVSRLLRQECDDLVEIGGAHLRPFVDLIAGAEPARHDEDYQAGAYPGRSMANGHGAAAGAVTHQGLPAAALPAPPTIYTAPVVSEYQRNVQPLPAARPGSHEQQEPDRGQPGGVPAQQGGRQAPPPGPAKPPRPPVGRSRSSVRQLVVTGGNLAGTTITLADQQITIGRAPDATLVLTDDYASTRHARLFPQNGEWIVEDLGSTNGTYLDRQKVTQPMQVPAGVPIRIGKTVLELRR